MKVLLFFIVTLTTTTIVSGQQVFKTVSSHLDSAVRNTKESLGLGVPVLGHTGYTTSDVGTNLTFVLSGRELGNGVDAYAKIGFQSDKDLTYFGITESGTGTSHPDFNQVFWFIHKKGTGQKWAIKVYDHNKEGKLIGEGVLDVDSYVEGNQDSIVNLDGGVGRIFVKKTMPIKFKLSAKHLSRLDEFSTKSDPYVKVYFRRGEHGSNNKFYTTRIIDNVENADWDEVIEFSNYQRGTEQYLFFKVRDSDTITQDDHLGETIINADKYVDLKAPQTVYLENSGENSSLTITPIP